MKHLHGKPWVRQGAALLLALLLALAPATPALAEEGEEMPAEPAATEAHSNENPPADASQPGVPAALEEEAAGGLPAPDEEAAAVEAEAPGGESTPAEGAEPPPTEPGAQPAAQGAEETLLAPQAAINIRVVTSNGNLQTSVETSLTNDFSLSPSAVAQIREFTIEGSIDMTAGSVDLAYIRSSMPSLKDLYFNFNGPTTLPNGALANTSGVLNNLRVVTLPGTITTVGEDAFKNCTALESVTGTAVTTVQQRAFYGCQSLQTASFGASLSVAPQAFYGCQALPNLGSTQLTYVAERAFQNCTGLTSANLSTANTVEANAFKGCQSLQNVDLANLAYLRNNSFEGCESLQFVDISNATTLGSSQYGGVFKDCTGLQAVVLPASAPSYFWHTDHFENTAAGGQLMLLVNGGPTQAAAYSAALGTLFPAGAAFPTIGGDVDAVLGQPLTLTVTPNGGGTAAFQWKKDGANIPGATSSSYTVPVAAYADAGDYSCEITLGSATYTTAVQAVTVNHHEISLNGDYTFPGVDEGYGPQAAHTVNVQNTGNAATGALSVSLSGSGQGAFELSASSLAGIGVGDDTSFTVAPKPGLTAGDYSATLTVSGTYAEASIQVSIHVDPAPAYTATLSPAVLDFGSVHEGYPTLPAEQFFTLQNTGNQPLTGIVATLPGNSVFSLTTPPPSTLAAGDSAQIGLTPTAGLANSSYGEEIRVTAQNGVALSGEVIFAVSPLTANTVTVTERGTDYDLVVKDADYHRDWNAGAGSSLIINGQTLRTPEDYTHHEGSLVITLKAAYLDTMPNGAYPVQVHLQSGPVVYTWLVVQVPGGQVPPLVGADPADPVSPPPAAPGPQQPTSPQTGDNGMGTHFWLMLLLGMAATGCACLVLGNRCKCKG